jgi:L-asparagine transporter-like permease
LNNITGGVSDFFSNTGTWFSLLAIVVIILIIAIVIFAVNRFGGGSVSGDRDSRL